MKSPINYYGGKQRLAPWIVSWFPEHEVYIEPFCGSAAVLFEKRPSTHEVLNDVDGEVVNFFRVLRDRPEDLERAVRLTPYARDEFLAAVERPARLDELERARRWWVRLTQSHSCLVTPWASFSSSVTRGSNKASTARSLIERMKEAAQRLAAVTIENRDAIALIRRLADANPAETVLYVDPPYVAETRHLRKNKKASEYQVDMATESEHRKLAEALRATKAWVFLSGYPSPLYDELYEDWPRVERSINVPSANLRGKEGSQSIERLWSNRPFTAQADLFELIA